MDNDIIKWTIDPSHSNISFKIRHLTIAFIKGEFKKYASAIETNGKDFSTARIVVIIDPDSIETGDSKRDEHLKSADFFAVEKHKEIKFISVKMVGNNGTIDLWGDIIIKNISRQVKLKVEFGGIRIDPDSGKEKAGFSLTGKIDRTLWGLKWNNELGKGDFLLSDEVIINCELELINESKTGAALKAKAEEEKNIPALSGS